MRSIQNFRPRALRSLLAVTALLVAGLLVPASSASAEGAGAEGPAPSVSGERPQTVEARTALLVGLVFRDASGNLATKVRAIGTNGAVCGTGNVQLLVSGLGFYQMAVVDATTRAGCPVEGGTMAFRLLYGSVDAGSSAIPSQSVRFASGRTLVASLTPAPASTQSSWLGDLPTTGGDDALLTWVGADGTPIEDALDALDALGVSVDRVSHYDAELRRWLSYTPGGPAFLQTYMSVGYGDLVRVRVK